MAAAAVALSHPFSAAIAAAAPSRASPSPFPSKKAKGIPKIPALSKTHSSSKLFVSSKSSSTSATPSSLIDKEERIFFDGGAHYGDLITNLLLGFSLVWLPLTIAALSRAFFLRYRFTNRRVTVISGFTGQDRTDFPYSAIKDVQVVPRLIGEWGDIVITLRDGTKVDIRSVPSFRMVADYCLLMADASANPPSAPRGF